MGRKLLQVIALGYGAAVLVVAAWFWTQQVQSVIDLLRIAYG